MHDICLNVHYSAPKEIWDMIGEIYRSMGAVLKMVVALHGEVIILSCVHRLSRVEYKSAEKCLMRYGINGIVN